MFVYFLVCLQLHVSNKVGFRRRTSVYSGAVFLYICVDVTVLFIEEEENEPAVFSPVDEPFCIVLSFFSFCSRSSLSFSVGLSFVYCASYFAVFFFFFSIK